ncbi:ComF family protein [Sulfobacillus thermosulfidooxidans]|uniref:ComF family protein n=1 Tax=Sulfobacillus thermosulfidooxidans TaxID=28034 RepID=UPI000368ECC2|nr:phosphoribosyltransferase family protein [Sulfobacillus thermosulfidooxidans]
MVWNPTGLFIHVSNPAQISDDVLLQCCPSVRWIGDFDDLAQQYRWVSVPTTHIPLNPEHPFPLARAISDFLEQKRYAPGQALLITDQEKDLFDAMWCQVRVVFVGSSITGEILPDAWCPIMPTLTTWQHHQFLGELRSEDWHSSGGLLVRELRPANYSANAILWGTGRYFAKNDPRSDIHLLTKRLLLLKSWRQGVIDPALIHIMRESLAIIEHNSPHFTMITAIPPKPRSPDRLGTLLRQAFPEDTRVHTSLIHITRPMEKQSQLGRTARKDNVAGAYRLAASSLVGQRILVVDDIVTTGATLSVVAMQLEQRGADVTCLALAVDQHHVSESTRQLPCPSNSCDGHMVIKLNRTSFRPFWGCTNYSRGCRKTLDYRSGINGYLQLSPSSAIIKDWDLPF